MTTNSFYSRSFVCSGKMINLQKWQMLTTYLIFITIYIQKQALMTTLLNCFYNETLDIGNFSVRKILIAINSAQLNNFSYFLLIFLFSSFFMCLLILRQKCCNYFVCNALYVSLCERI